MNINEYIREQSALHTYYTQIVSPDSSVFCCWSMLGCDRSSGDVAGGVLLCAWTCSPSFSLTANCCCVPFVAWRLPVLLPSLQRSLTALPNIPPNEAWDHLFVACAGESASAGTASIVVDFSRPVLLTSAPSLRLVPRLNVANKLVSSSFCSFASVLASAQTFVSTKSGAWSKLVPLRMVVACGLEGLIEKLKDDGVVGWEVEVELLELERSTGCEKVNWTIFVELVPVVRGLFWVETEGAKDGCETLKSSWFALAPAKEKKFVEALLLLLKEPELVCGSLMLKAGSGKEELCETGLGSKMGLNSDLLPGLKLKLVEAKPLLSKTPEGVLNTPVVPLLDGGCPNTVWPKARGGDGPSDELETNASWEAPMGGGWRLLSRDCIPKPEGPTGGDPSNEGCSPNTEPGFLTVCPKPTCDGGCSKAGGWVPPGTEAAGVAGGTKKTLPWGENCPKAEAW